MEGSYFHGRNVVFKPGERAVRNAADLTSQMSALPRFLSETPGRGRASDLAPFLLCC
jgi:hypothetical protein